MIVTPTTFILGAGASAPYGYPTAKELKKNIIDNLTNKNSADFQELVSCGFEQDEIETFAYSFRYSSLASVDSFLEKRTEYIDIGKSAIAQQLLKAESDHEFKKLFEDGWYAYILNRMDTKFEDFLKNKVSFITFNYDRSLEMFLMISLASRYGKGMDEIAPIISKIPILHIYGHFGALEWESEDPSLIREYGEISGPKNIKKAAKGIKIVSEAESDETPEFLAAQKIISQSERIIFLGFGYHEENMRRLNLPLSDANKFFGGSAKSLSETERRHLTHAKYQGLHLGDPEWDALKYLRNETRLAND